MRLLFDKNTISQMPEIPLKEHLLRYYDLLFEDNMGPVFVVVDLKDVITGDAYNFVGNHGLLSDLFEEHVPGHPEFSRPYEWVSHLPDQKIYEMLLLVNGEDGYLIFIPEAIVEAHPDLKWVLTSDEVGGLSPPQPLY